ncbi:MAG: type II secretion system protein [Solirubrobacterales bacterium]|nr:type II secretion system protein [Solirubrobacterales bacterium]
MQGSHSLIGAMRRRLRNERGWALIDAMASAVVVVLAFVGTTMAFNGATASVARDQKKTQALIVAQNELNAMRGVGQRKIGPGLQANGDPSLLDLDNTTKTVVYRGVSYNIAYDAYYVTGLGNDQQDACSVAYSVGGGTARYIYMRVRVTYAGQGTSSNTTNQYLSSPASLDAYYSPEGGGVQADTGTLRVYVLNRSGQVVTFPGTVTLKPVGSTDTIVPQTTNATTGCYLFTGLVRNTYVVTVTGVGTKQDVYMSNTSTGGGTISTPVVVPDRGSLSRDVRIDDPVTVTPKFYVATGTQTKYEVRGVNGNLNPITALTPTTSPWWIAGSSQIKSSPNADFSALPSGLAFMPHTVAPALSLPDKMFPSPQGYSAYAGPCEASDPNAGAADGVNNYVQIPTSASDSTWVPSGNYTTAELWLSQIRATLTLAPAARPTSGIVRNTNYYWNQTLSSTGGTVWVRVTADAEGGSTTPRCRSNFDKFNTWVQLPGTIATAGAFLSDNAESLPPGTYDLCVKMPYRYWSARSTDVSSTTLPTGSNSSTDRWGYISWDAQALAYRSFLAKTAAFAWASNARSLDPTGPSDATFSTTDCTA